MEVFSQMIDKINGVIWGIGGVLLILGSGLWISVRCGFPQLRLFRQALADFIGRLTDSTSQQEGTSPFRALCTALAATVGTGNIAGVAGAIAIGGPGAVFWMWVSAFVGMATKFAESTLAVRFREKKPAGEYLGGPMYIIRRGLGPRFRVLGMLYSFFGLFAAFGVGNATQVNAVISAMAESARCYGFSLEPSARFLVGMVMALLVIAMVSGGSKRIGQMTEILIPFVSAAYILICAIAIGLHVDRLPMSVGRIITGAWAPKAVTGGAVGSFFLCLRIGVSRGVFTNEAGMGTAAMAHGSANVAHPAQQGLMGIMEVFLDTVVICTLTALVILTSGVDIPYGTAAGAELTVEALAASFGPWISIFLCGCLCIFAFSTILGWGLYAGRCVEFLLGRIYWPGFAMLQACGVVLGVALETGIVWSLAELMNGLMALPNLFALLLLSPELARLTFEYTSMCRGRKSAGGTYENFHQCKSL